MKNNKFKKGYSLIELLVVLGVFALLATLATQAVVLTLRSTKKSESSVKVKENLNYALGVMERQLRSATAITSCSAPRVDFTDSAGNQTYFECISTPPNAYIASGSATVRLSSTDIKVTPCTFTCPATLSSVTISLTGSSASATGIENSIESVSTTVLLRQSN